MKVTLTDVLLVLLFGALVIDIWVTRRWLSDSRRMLIEIQRQARTIADATKARP